MADRVCILYDSRCAQSVIAARYCRWIVQFVLELRAETFDTSGQRVPVLQEENAPPYASAFVLSIIDGVDRLTDADWARLQAANGYVPLFTFYRAAAVIARNPVAAGLFGPVSAADLEEVTVAPAQLTYDEPSIARAASQMSDVTQAEPLVAIKKMLSGDSKDAVFARLGERVVAFRRGINIFDGQLRVAVPRTKYPLNHGRAGLYLRQFAVLARAFRPPAAPPVRSVWPVCVRIDDPPASWWVLRQREPMLQAEDYRRQLQLLEQYNAKLTVMCVPCLPQDGAAVPWWKIAPRWEEMLEPLRRGVAAERVEIACHGLTHLTIGRGVPSRFRERFNRLLNPYHNPTREFYDDMRRRAIPLANQRRVLRASIDLLQNYFQCRVRSFTPGAHNWDDNTERAAAEEGIEFFACDTTWTKFSPGEPICKNPAPLGEVPTTDDRLVYLSRLLAWPPAAEDMEALHELGVPLTISSHTYGSTSLRPDRLEDFLSSLKRFADHRHFTISELGDLLRGESRTVTSAGFA